MTEQSVRGYELQDKIGEGGFGAVYRAFQPVIEREVAVKVILPKYANQPDFIRNFETEVQLVARLEHPYIVPLYDYWRDPGGAYLVMRRFQGSLRQLLTEKGALSPHTVLRLLEQIAVALHTAHRKQVVHRDLKPDNILLDDDGNAYLSDFGIARIIGQDPTTQSISGTLAYISPQQLQSFAPSPQMDIYSLGIMLYEMLTGKHPYAGLSSVELVYSHMERPIPDITQFDAALPPQLNAVLQQATAKDTAQRYGTILDLLHDFRAVFADGNVPVPPRASDEPTVNPYKGLRAFDVADAADFFGRENLVHTMAERLRHGERFLAVVGPSGSGKSSVVKAGLLAALRRAAITDADKWFTADFVPGMNPLHNLAQALASVSPVTLSNAKEQLASNERGLIWIVDTILADTAGEIVLVIDQFEEIFTLADDQQCNQLLDLLTTALTSDDTRLRVIITLRADFYDRPLLYEGFGQLVQDHTQVVLPLSADELEHAITSPAERVGVEVERELIAAMVADVREEPGALPLLQYSLTELFENRSHQKMTLSAYRDSGGVLGVLAKRADEVYQTLSDTQKIIAQQVFLRLVRLGEGTEDTRRRVQRAELQQIIQDKAALNTVLDVFGTARLLTFDVENSIREPLVEVAHEALIREWRQLREWLTESRNDIRLQRLLAIAAAEWSESHQDTSYLLHGSRLTQFEEWAQTSSVLLSPDEKTFLETSVAAQEAEFDARERAQLERQRLQVQVQSRQQQVILALGFGVILAFILTVIAFIQANNARRAESDAVAAQATSEYQAVYANAQQLALRAEQIYTSGQSSLALVLAIEANRLQNPPPDAIRVLSELSTYPLIKGYLAGHNEPALALAFTPDGQRLLTGACGNRRGSRCSSGELLLWDITTGQIIRRLIGHNSSITTVAIAADGRLALSGASDGSIILWDLYTREQLRTYEGQIGDTALNIAFAPDGSRFGVITANHNFAIREIATGQILNFSNPDIDTDYFYYSSAFLQDNSTALISGCSIYKEESYNACEGGSSRRGIIFHINTITGEIIKTFDVPPPMPIISTLAFSRASNQIIARSIRYIGVWDVTDTKIQSLVQVIAALQDEILFPKPSDNIGISSDGTVISFVSGYNNISQFDMDSDGFTRNFTPPSGIAGTMNTTSFMSAQYLAISLSDNRIMLVEFNSPDQLYDWVLSHRTIQTLTCEERVTYGVEPRCDADGNIPSTPTPYPTITPFPTVTLPVWTPIPSPTPSQ